MTDEDYDSLLTAADIAAMKRRELTGRVEAVLREELAAIRLALLAAVRRRLGDEFSDATFLDDEDDQRHRFVVFVESESSGAPVIQGHVVVPLCVVQLPVEARPQCRF